MRWAGIWQVWCGNLEKERDHLEELVVDGMIILECIFKE
jgi:hypothetical protein